MQLNFSSWEDLTGHISSNSDSRPRTESSPYGCMIVEQPRPANRSSQTASLLPAVASRSRDLS
jgi:hypothetical protein